MRASKLATRTEHRVPVAGTLWKGTVLTACVLGGCLVLIAALVVS